MTKTANKTTKPGESPKNAEIKQDKARNPLPARDGDYDEHEDGDIATPKRDRYGPDDEPL